MTDDADTDTDTDRDLARRAAAALERPLALPWIIALLMLLAAMGLEAGWSNAVARALLALALLVGGAAAYTMVRVRYDARVFRRWATSEDLRASIARFDARWSHGASEAPRSMADRVAGASRWKRRALLAAGAQGVCTLTGLWPLRQLLD